MPQVGDRITAHIVALSPEWEGHGVFGTAGVENSTAVQDEGAIVRVPGVWPGDIVECALLARSRHHGHWFGRAMRIIAHGVTRESAVCPVQAICGGCPGLPFPYAAQVAQKRARLEALFPGAGFVAAPQPLKYRDKVKWIVGPGTDGRATVGFYRHNSHRFLPVNDCAVLVPELRHLARRLPEVIGDLAPFDETTGTGLLRAILAKSTSAGEVIVTFVCASRPDPETEVMLARTLDLEGVCGVTCNLNPGKGNRLTGPEEWTLAGTDFLREADHPHGYLVNATCFSQAHHAMAKSALEAIVETLRPVSLPVIDLYCGVGPIALALSAAGLAVTGVEVDARSIELAKRAGASNTWIAADVNATDSMPVPFGEFTVVVNPPRQGLSAELIDWVANKRIPKLMYMSCNPQTLSRDALQLKKCSFTLDIATGYDMFPQTPWFETVAIFSSQVKS